MAAETRGGRRVCTPARARRAVSSVPLARATTVGGSLDDTARPTRAVRAAAGAVPASVGAQGGDLPCRPAGGRAGGQEGAGRVAGDQRREGGEVAEVAHRGDGQHRAQALLAVAAVVGPAVVRPAHPQAVAGRLRTGQQPHLVDALGLHPVVHQLDLVRVPEVVEVGVRAEGPQPPDGERGGHVDLPRTGREQVGHGGEDGPVVGGPADDGVGQPAHVGLDLEQGLAQSVGRPADAPDHPPSEPPLLEGDVEPVDVDEGVDLVEVAQHRVEGVDPGGEEGGHPRGPRLGVAPLGFDAGPPLRRGGDGAPAADVGVPPEDHVLGRLGALEEPAGHPALEAHVLPGAWPAGGGWAPGGRR